MNTSEKWLQKYIKSFTTGNDYQAIKLFDIALFHLIEEAQFDHVQDYFMQTLPILEKKHLFHEVDLIINKCLGHLKKKPTFVSSVSTLLRSFVSFLKENYCSEASFQALRSILAFSGNIGDKELIEFYSHNYPEILVNLSESHYFEEILFLLFDLFVSTNQFEFAFKIADPAFFKSITTLKELEYGMLALLILAIESNLDKAKDKLLYFRQILSKKLQDEKIYKCVTEFILVAVSQDKDWLNELKNHFGPQLKANQILRKLAQKFIIIFFPETKKSNLFDLFKFE